MEESRALVRKASRGEAVAIGALLEQHLSRLEAFVRLRMGPELRGFESASDLVQSACREVLQHVDRYRYHGESQFRHWLYTTALRKVQNRVRYLRAGRRAAVRVEPRATASGGIDPLETFARSLSDTPSRQIMRREEIARLETAFASLPEHYREVITLSRIVGLSHREIAEHMAKTESATRMLLSRAMAALSKALGDR